MKNAISRSVQEALQSTPLFSESNTVGDLNTKLNRANDQIQDLKQEVFTKSKEMDQLTSKAQQFLQMYRAGALNQSEAEIIENLYQGLVLDRKSIFEVI